MWHCGGAFLFRAEVFFCFSDFGSLQVADFQSDLGKNACNDAECGDVFSMVIALNDLGSYDFRSEAEFLAYVGFYEWIDIRIGANGAGEFADCHFFSSTFHSFDVAEGFGVPEQNFQAEGGRFSMDTVCSADGWCVLEFHSSSLQNFCESFQIGNEDLGCLFDLDIESGILDIGGGQAHVDVLGFIAYVFADVCQESNDVMVDFMVDFMNAVYVEVCLFLDNLYCFFRNAAQFRVCFAGCDLDIQHCLPFISFVPNLAHFRACVPWNHLNIPFRLTNAGANFTTHDYAGCGGLCKTPGDAGSITNSKEIRNHCFKLV